MEKLVHDSTLSLYHILNQFLCNKVKNFNL